jgi:hypothetical protein
MSFTVERKYTHGALWSVEVRSISAGSTIPVRRTSPAAIDAMRDVAMSVMRIAVR